MQSLLAYSTFFDVTMEWNNILLSSIQTMDQTAEMKKPLFYFGLSIFLTARVSKKASV